MTAIEAFFVRLKSMADGSLQITAEVDPRNAVAAFTLFASPGTPMALAALQTAKSTQAPQPKGGEISHWVAMRCQETGFQKWLTDEFGECEESESMASSEAAAAVIVRRVCGIKSRADLDGDEDAAARFHSLIRVPFSKVVLHEK